MDVGDLVSGGTVLDGTAPVGAVVDCICSSFDLALSTPFFAPGDGLTVGGHVEAVEAGGEFLELDI